MEDYDRESLKTFGTIYILVMMLEGTSKNDSKEMSQEYLAKKLAALDQAHSAQPYDHVIRRLMIEKNVDPKISEKWNTTLMLRNALH